MRSREGGRWGVALAVAGVALLAAASGDAAERRGGKAENPHAGKDRQACIVCHVSAPAEGSRPARENNLRFGGDIVALCSSCHDGYRHMHPVKIAMAPDMKSPEELPLDRDGKITCITCHDAMEASGVHRRRRIVGRALCLNCHDETSILAQVNWYPTHLGKGEQGRLELKVVEFRIAGRRAYLGDSVLLYYLARNVDTGEFSFGTNVMYDDGSHGDRVARDSIYTLMEKAEKFDKSKRVVYTGWVLDSDGRKSNTVTLAVEYE